MLIPFIICTALSLPVLAEQIEAQRHSSSQASAVAQARVQARAKIPIQEVIQLEAQRSFNAQAVAVAESRKTQRLQSSKHPADQSRTVLQYERP